MTTQALLFQQELSKLNAEQRKAVETIDGPVLVIAGPGTGKTQILSARIGHILAEGLDVQAHNILCLTYTDAGTIAMRKRLLKFIGTDAYRVAIHTFHSFCNSVIQDNKQYFGATNFLQPIDELESVELFYELIENIPSDNILKRFTGDVYYEIDPLKRLFEAIKKENLSPETLELAARAYINHLEENPDFQYKRKYKEFNAGDPNPKKIEEETLKLEKFIAGVNLFATFNGMMQQRNRYDYHDMINWVIKAFHEHDDLLARYQEQFQYILVDEFQDTNGSQATILYQLCSFWGEEANIFAVGDDDQSVYSFQGAEISRINAFVDKFKNTLSPILLKHNYRSSQEILDASKGLISHNNARLVHDQNLQAIYQSQGEVLDKSLIASNPAYASISPAVFIHECTNAYHEEAHLISLIEAIQKAQTIHNEPLLTQMALLEQKNAGIQDIQQVAEQLQHLGNVAVIYKQHADVTSLVKALSHRKIPYNLARQENILELPIVNQLLSILEYLKLEDEIERSGEHLLFKILHYQYFHCSKKDISQIAHQGAENKKYSWRYLMSNTQKHLLLGFENSRALTELEQNLSRWQKDLHNMTLQTLFEKILQFSGVIKFVLSHPEEKLWLLEVITSLFDFIKNESVKQPQLSIADLLQKIKKLKDNKISINLNRIVRAEHGLNLVTAHSSKGLEYDHVFVIKCNKEYWESRRTKSGGYKFPPVEYWMDEAQIKSMQEANPEEEERRLFYVAMTRAKKGMHLLYSTMKITDKSPDKASLQESQFLSEIKLASPALQINKVSYQTDEPSSVDEMVQYLSELLTPAPLPNEIALEKEYIAETLSKYKLNVTHLNKYLKCKLSFYYENILKIPSARSASMGFGNAVHYAIEHLFRAMLEEENKTFPDTNTFVGYFKKGMQNYASHFTPSEYKLKIEFAEQLLPDYYNTYVQDWEKAVRVEYRFSNILFDAIPLSGAIDKIEFLNGKECNVVDYKTGDPDRAKLKMKAPTKPGADLQEAKFEEVYGGDYWRQIVFYKILMDQDKTHEWKMVSGEIDLFQKAKKGNFEKLKLTVTPEDELLVKKQIKDTYKGIMAQDFSGCGDKDCQWCTFVREQYTGILIPEEEVD